MSGELSKDLIQAIEIIEKYCGQIELISYGLAPNPNGFCREVVDTEGKFGKVDHNTINLNINYLNDNDTKELIKLYL